MSHSLDWRLTAFCLIHGFIILFALAALPAAAQNTPELISINRDGTASGDRNSGTHSISADSRFVAFVSEATNLVGPSTFTVSPNSNVFVRDTQTGTTTLVSVNRDGTGGGNRASRSTVISGNGRYVLFGSFADNLVANDNNTSPDVFVRDLQAGTTTLVSVNRDGTRGGFSFSDPAAITPDGRFVLFSSAANDLVSVPRGANLSTDIYVRDMALNRTTLVSINRAGTASGNDTSEPDARISADGRFVVFGSRASDLVENDTNNDYDIFVRDLQIGVTSLVSTNVAGVASGNGFSRYPAITPDGGFVIFTSTATDLVTTPDGNDAADLYLRDLRTGVTQLVSVAQTGNASGLFDFAGYGISADGRFVVFTSAAADITNNDFNNSTDVFVRDVQAGTTALVSVNRDGTATGNAASSRPRITPDGQFVAFESLANNLVSGGDATNGFTTDVFVRELATGATTLASPNSADTRTGNGFSSQPRISDDGRFVVFSSQANDLVTNDLNNAGDVFRFAVPQAQLRFAFASFVANEADGIATITVTLTGGAIGAASVDYSTSDGTAVAGADYTAVAGTLTFQPGETTKTFTVPLANDAEADPNETVTLTLSNATGGTLNRQRTAVLIIRDDDVPGVFVQDANIAERNNNFSVTIEITLSAPSAMPVTIEYVVSDGTAKLFDDYFVFTEELTFIPGEVSKLVNVIIIGDRSDEPDEFFTLRLTNATNANISRGVSRVTIFDDDPTPAISLTDVMVTERTNYAVFIVRLTNPSSRTVTVAYATADATATSGADYQGVTGTFYFSPGQTTTSLSVEIRRDQHLEPDETFLLNLSQPTNAVISDAQGVAVIVDPAFKRRGFANRRRLR